MSVDSIPGDFCLVEKSLFFFFCFFFLKLMIEKTYRHNGTDISDSSDDHARQRGIQVRVADVRIVTEEAMMRHSPGFLRDERKASED